jgi:hypothetical protein
MTLPSWIDPFGCIVIPSRCHSQSFQSRYFSNERLNFKHSFWAAPGPEKGIFAAFPDYLDRESGGNSATR